MANRKHQINVQFVEDCVQNLQHVSFANIDLKLEQERQLLLQSFQNMHVLINAPSMFSKILDPVKRRYKDFLRAIEVCTLQANQDSILPFSED